MSNLSLRSEAVRKYFTKTPDKPVEPSYAKSQAIMAIGALLGILSLAFIFSGSGFQVFIGIILGFFGVKTLLKEFSEYSKQKRKYQLECETYKKDFEMAEPKPSDKQIDDWRNEDINRIIAESLKRLDLAIDDYVAEPLILGGPASLEEVKYARGKDGLIRYSHFNVLVVYLTEYHVATYQSINSLEFGLVLSDETKEFPYREITNLGTQTTKEKITIVSNAVASESGFQEFTLATSGANVIKVPYRFARNADNQGELQMIGEEKTINSIRKKLQDYKQKYERHD